jgi:hypothetical protein
MGEVERSGFPKELICCCLPGGEPRAPALWGWMAATEAPLIAVDQDTKRQLRLMMMMIKSRSPLGT